MMKRTLIAILMLAHSIALFAKTDSLQATFLKPLPRNYEVKHAIEIESLVPMFFTGGYHFAVGYRYKKIRVRASIIQGGSFNADAYSLNHSTNAFKRFYLVSPGIFLGYNLWKNLEL